MGLSGDGNGGGGSCKEDNASEDTLATGGCSTPKGPRFRIPEKLSCPPAPKKPKLCSKGESSPVVFYTSPDIEVFFATRPEEKNCSRKLPL
ncbi:hypothetical protein SLEP1_g35129 [Rubroshorea leprosula]|uniref:Uncharacterized protein n=1 Tax=Rubroshorea leprosula TaxID=152421 RepID=A0AAV5KM94_9ROSI|nr:hypothetical protein SLEP1_g35129 [Rubroshorea leprosula]